MKLPLEWRMLKSLVELLKRSKLKLSNIVPDCRKRELRNTKWLLTR